MASFFRMIRRHLRPVGIVLFNMPDQEYQTHCFADSSEGNGTKTTPHTIGEILDALRQAGLYMRKIERTDFNSLSVVAHACPIFKP